MGSLANRVWNGPFFAGLRPESPTVGWVLLKVLESLWRLLISIVLIGAFGALAIYFYDKSNPPLSSQVDAFIVPNAKECKTSVGRPMFLKLTNRSKETVGKTSLSISAFEQGQSTDLIDFNYKDFDGVIRSGSWISYCVAQPEFQRQPNRPVAWAVKVSYATSLDADYVEPQTEQPPVVTTNQRKTN
jgi:hypothetical protein